MVCSTSKGEVVLMDNLYREIYREKVHGFEAWVAHLSRHDENVFFSGGDDCKFVGLDLRSNGAKSFTKT